MSTNIFADAPVISVYTREQGIKDGELVDVSELAAKQGFKYPVAMTRAAWADCVAWSKEDNERKGTAQDETGRLWDVLTMLRFGAKKADGSIFEFQLLRVPREGLGKAARPATLKAICGPGDDAAPVITVMLPHED